jgi:hypothetical protein
MARRVRPEPQGAPSPQLNSAVADRGKRVTREDLIRLRAIQRRWLAGPNGGIATMQHLLAHM